MGRNILTGLKIVSLLVAASWSASSKTTLLDRAGYQSAAIALTLGANTGTAFDASNKITAVLEESDSTVDATFTTVAAADQVASVAVIDANAKASTVQTWEYKGFKRYVRLNLAETGAIVIPLAVMGLLDCAINEPVGAVVAGTAST